MNKKIILGLSGGMDSATLCSYYLDQGDYVYPIQFEYGSKHNQYEREAAKLYAAYYGLTIKEISLDFISNLFKSNLLKTGGEIPEGHYEQENMSLTVVPARNIIFASIMAGYAWSIDADTIALGVHAGDHAIYEDCRAGFIAAMNAAIISGTGDRIHIEAPFQYLNKTDILKLGISFNTPYCHTRTCFLPETKVHTKNGLVSIELIEKGDEVYSHTGSLRKVSQIHIKKYKGSIKGVEIYGGGKIYCTPDHELFTSQGFNQVKDLIPMDNNYLIPYIKLDYPDKNFSGDFILDKDFALFLGLFAAEGSYLINRNKKYGATGIDFSINSDEFSDPLVQKVYDWLAQIKNPDNQLYSRENVVYESGFNFGIHDFLFARKLVKICGQGLTHERMYEFVLGWDEEFQYEFLKGYFFGDGFYCNQQKRLQASGTNPNLMNVIFNILVQMGKQPRYQFKKAENCNGVSDQFQIFLPDYLFPELICDSVGIQSRILKDPNNPFIKPEGRKIKSISDINYDGFVYDLGVEDDHSYIVQTIPVHNCYKDQLISCGKCGSCQERLEAWENIGLKDPIIYEGEIK